MNENKNDRAKEVKVKITGTHRAGAERDVIESTCTGLLYERDGRQYLKYTETDRGSGTKRNALLKIVDRTVTLQYRGSTETTMIFEVGKHTRSMYITSMGSMPIDIDTKSLVFELSEKSLQISIDYKMSLSGGEAQDSSISIFAD